MRYLQLTFFCRFTQQAHLPPYKGSTLRGAFGRALKQVCCALRRQDCDTCLLRSGCTYARVFEPKSVHPGLRKLAAPPHPYVLEPPATLQTRFVPEERFAFNLLLVGEFSQALPYFVYAVERMGEGGLGKGNAQFVLERVEAGGQVIYHRGADTLTWPGDYPTLPDQLSDGGSSGELSMELTTPLRLKSAGHLSSDLQFVTLVRAALRRFSSLHSCYGAGEPDLDYGGLLRRAEQVERIEDTTRWHDWSRYSNRQGEEMRFGGLLGRLRFADVPAEHRLLLELCRPFHLGKQTTFGLGAYRLEAA